MKLLTKEIERKLPALYSTDGKPDEDRKVIAKFYTPWTNWTWYVLEGEYSEDHGTWMFFGWVEGHAKEFGHFLLSDLESVRGPAGLRIERDRHFSGVLADVRPQEVFDE